MSGSVPNLEEAAYVAAEFIQSLDNLPSEVQYLLQEIRHKEVRSQDLQQEIAKESAKYVRHSFRTPPPAALNPKDAALPAKVRADYDEVARLADEKLVLAQRIVTLVTRARARLDHDLARVLMLQGESPDIYQPATSRPNPASQITESLRNAFAPQQTPQPGATGEVAPASPASGTSGPSVQKKRRLTSNVTNASIKLPSPAPIAQPAPARSRLSQQVHPRQSRARPTFEEEADEDAEGEDEFDEGGEGDEEGGDSEDKQIYCFCQKLSYGEMIACDNKDCPYQWFHLPCVNLKAGVPLPEVFYCDECIKKGFGPGGNERQRKGRKK